MDPNVTVTSEGVVSGVPVKPFEEFALDSEGFLCARSEGCPATGGDRPEPVELRAVMTADKKMIIGVFTTFEDYGAQFALSALFTLIRRPAAPAATVRFSASTYSTPEGNTTATITVLREGYLGRSHGGRPLPGRPGVRVALPGTGSEKRVGLKKLGRNIEERHGFAGALPSAWRGLGGPRGPPSN